MAEKEYIERDGVMQKFADRVWLSNHSDFSTTPTWNQAVQIVEDFPAADVRPVVRGKWEEVEVTWLSDIEDQPDAIASMFCPKCERFANHVYHYGDPTHGMNFCPNCGADMREES